MSGYEIAVLGYSVRVPGADTVADLWDIVRSGRDVVTRHSANVGVTAGAQVHAYGVLPSVEGFDERHFGYSPREAADIDPQQRLLLECALEALESAAVPTGAGGLDIGTYCSVGLSSYLLNTLEPGRVGDDRTSVLLGGDGHYAATRIAYKLGLTGPAVSVGTACSSSLVAVHLAAQALLNGDCDVALAGGLDVEHPQPRTYLYQDGGVMSRTGVCRPFDAAADGVVFASGGGLVVLAPLALAEQRGWPVRAVLHGTAVNNDGSNKASFTAPRASRQADAIRQALAVAEIEPADVDYLECHGTGTPIGDRSELLAVAEVFDGVAAPALGSLKANLGHLRVGAGVAGLVKACEVVARRTIPPMANLTAPMDRVTEIGATVPAEPVRYDDDRTLVAGVSSFGFGGTNAHAVVGSYPAAAPAPAGAPDADLAVVRVSAPTPDACLATAAELGRYLRTEPGVRLADVARTLQDGRASRAYRCAAVGDRERISECLTTSAGTGFVEGWAGAETRAVVLFPGQGSDLRPFGRTLYGWEPRFTAALDGYWHEVRRLHPAAPPVGELLAGTALPPPVAHAGHVALGLALWDEVAARGLSAAGFAGYSLGEYAAAVAAGALPARGALALVVARAELLDGVPGEMYAVDATDEQHAELAGRYHLAIRQTDRRAVYALDLDTRDRFVAELRARSIPAEPVGVGVPYHSPLLDGAAATLRDLTGQIGFQPVPGFLPALADPVPPDAGYFADHLCRPLDYRRVAAGIEPDVLLVDLDPRRILSRSLAADGQPVVPVDAGDRAAWLGSLAEAWVQGVPVRTGTAEVDAGRLIPLPTTRFQRSAHLKPMAAAQSPTPAAPGGVRREPSIDRWMYYPSWKALRQPEDEVDHAGQRWLVLARPGADDGLVEALRARGIEVLTAVPGTGEGHVVVPGDKPSMLALLDRLDVAHRPVDRVVHLWCADELAHGDSYRQQMSDLGDELAAGFYSLLYLVQGLAERQGAHLVHLDIVGRGMHPLDATQATPERALLAGPALVVPQDLPFATTRSVELAGTGAAVDRALLAELLGGRLDKTVVLGARDRWVRTYERDTVAPLGDGQRPFRLRDGGVYLITGGVGGIGMTIAEYLVRECSANLVLTGLDVVPTEELLHAPQPPDIDDPVLAERTRRIRALIAKGAKVITAACDAADLAQTRALFDTIDTVFGRLDGVVHAAGVFETQRAFRGLEDTGPADCSRRLLPKVDGTIVLAECLRGRRLDFLLMQSSLSSHLGGLGFYAYTAGNAYMDAFAERHRTGDLPWMSVNWDGWVFSERDEVQAGSVVSPSFASPDFGVVAEIAIRPSEGAEIYARLMNLRSPRLVLVSTADFRARVDQWVTMDAIRRPRHRDGGPPTSPPDTGTAAMTPTQARVAAAWAEMLGTTDLTPESNFFAIGGDSLLGVALAYRLSTEFDTVLSVITMFDNPTIAAMAAEIERTAGKVGAGAGA